MIKDYSFSHQYHHQSHNNNNNNHHHHHQDHHDYFGSDFGINYGHDSSKMKWKDRMQSQSMLISFVLCLLMMVFDVNLAVDQLLVTFLHESSHGIAAVLTGGNLVHFELDSNGGMAFTDGGIRSIVLFSGYIGSCMWGSVLLIVSRHKGREKIVLGSLSGFMLFFSLLFVRNLFGFVFSITFAAIFGYISWRKSGWQVNLLLTFLAMRCILESLRDVQSLILYSIYTFPGMEDVVTDAGLMSKELTNDAVPPIVFAIIVAVMCMVIFIGTLWYLWKKKF